MRGLKMCALVSVLAALAISSTEAVRIGINCTVSNKDVLATVLNEPRCRQDFACVYEEKTKTCHLDEADTVSLADGSENATQQPELDPQQWLLTTDELTRARGGVARNGLQTDSAKNNVQVFASSDEFFTSAYEAIESAGRSSTKDRIYLVGWSIADLPFLPLNSSTNTSVCHVLQAAIEREVDVYALYWTNINSGEPTRLKKMRDWMNALTPPNGTTAQFLFDDRLPYLQSSHHQKTLAVKTGNDLVAFVGGVDLTVDRWDTLEHDQAKVRAATGIKSDYDGWVDVHVRIHGPAALDVVANVEQRWNSMDQTGKALTTDLADFQNPDYYDIVPLQATTITEWPTTGTHHVQILRTFSCQYAGYKEFAPRGEVSILQGFLKAIANARNFIYIEDQYFIMVPDLQKALLAALPRIQRLIVFVQRVSTRNNIAGYGRYQLDMIGPLQQFFPNKVQVYTTKEARNVYIHSKTIIIDDVFVSVGSANWNLRSMTSDSEMAALIVDSVLVQSSDKIQVAKLAHHFRLKKFQEKTGIAYEELARMPFIEAANALDHAAADNSSLIEHLVLQSKAFFDVFNNDTKQFVDPDDRCERAASNAAVRQAAQLILSCIVSLYFF
ncbi:TPA: hypothetical protein N0F65_011095 [Lagenidium giganteum]|uniref:phospholipase D n=1 Tax=Lagenidium giganteum TaxID=4803 RepID=A0AAV2ZHF3_9STRA|nr:TPA: hypothetical protein N0F65_011095 [Lagenidium giganteum]